MGAPVCTLKPSTPGPSAPPVYAGNIPPATADNLVQVVNAIRAVLTNGQSSGGSGGSGGYGGGGGFHSNQQNQFTVTNQVTKDIKVYDPNDPSGNTFVTVKQIVSLTLQNPYDHSSWVWNQSGGVPDS